MVDYFQADRAKFQQDEAKAQAEGKKRVTRSKDQPGVKQTLPVDLDLEL